MTTTTAEQYAERRQQLIAALSMMVSGDELSELIETSEEKADPVAYLEAEWDRVSSSGTSVQDKLTEAGIDIEEVTGKSIDVRTGKEVVAVVGYEITKVIDERKQYAGITLQFGPRYRSVPFRDREHARQGALVWLDVQREQGEQINIVRKWIRVPMADNQPLPKQGMQLNWRMTPEETRTFNRVLAALRRQNVELEPGKPIISMNDVLRWLEARLAG